MDRQWELGAHIGLVYRPLNSRRFVIRGGYGLYYNAMTGNRSASAAANLPFWGVESISYGLTQLQNWQTVWSSDPNSYGIFSIGEAQDPNPGSTQPTNGISRCRSHCLSRRRSR